MPSSIIRDLLKTQRAQLFGLCELRGVKRLGPIYEQSRAELEAKLAALRRAGKGQTFGAYHLRQVLAQVYDVVLNFQDELGLHISRQQSVATALAQRQIIKSAKVLEKVFTGHAPVLQIEQVAVLRGIDRRVVPSLLDRYRKSARFYGPPVVTKIKNQLALSLVQGETLDDAVDRVAGTDGVFADERWRAERIARTELSYGFHAVQHQTMREMAARDMPGLMKRLVATHDDRTGKDSLKLDGQTVPVDQPFIWNAPKAGGGTERIEYMHPPNRPHDREVVIPWRAGWKAGAVPEAGAVEPRAPPDDLTP